MPRCSSKPLWRKTIGRCTATILGRYSTLAQINPSNVSKLTQAWIHNSKPAPDAKTNWRRVESKTTPLVINGVMYFTTPFQSLVAVEPETGKKLWSFDHKYHPRASRGIAYWAGDKNSPPTLFFGTEDGLLIAVNAKTGKKVPGFANEGELDLKSGMKDNYPSALYGLNGAPAGYRTTDPPALDLRAPKLDELRIHF